MPAAARATRKGLPMWTYIVRRLIQSVGVMIGVSVMVFMLAHSMPGGPALMILGFDATPEQIAVVERNLGLDRPIAVQYVDWLWKALHGDLGNSYQDNRPILPDLLDRMPATIELVLASMFIAILIGVPIGIASAVKRNSFVDNVARVFALMGVSMPGFWLGLILILVLSKELGWLPSAGREGIKSVIMPAMSLGFIMAGLIMRMVRSSVLEVLKADYLKTARAKGLSEFVVIFKHAMRNACLPVITVIALQSGALLGGTVVIETIFAWPGIGRFCYMRMLQRDIPTIMGNLMLFAVIVSVLNIITDILYAIFDPRIRYK